MFYTQYSNKKTGCVCRKLRGVFGVGCMEKIEAKIDSGSGVQEKNLYSIQSTGKMLSKNGAGSGPSGPLLALAFEVSGLIEPTALLHATDGPVSV